MEERENIISLFVKLYNGSPWIDVNILDTLKVISAQQAATKVLPNCNSIWQIVDHMVSWRENVLQRVQGKVLKTPANNYVETISDTSEKAWSETLERMQRSQDHWLAFLKRFDTVDYKIKYPTNDMTYYEHIHGIIQHDAYHLGQIVLLAKMVR